MKARRAPELRADITAGLAARRMQRAARGHHLVTLWLDRDFAEHVNDLIVSLGRWGNQDMQSASQWPLSVVYRRWRALARLLEQETKASK